MSSSTRDAAYGYIRRGYAPVPIPHRTKRPVLDGWPKLKLTEADVRRYFNGKPQNIGLILGEASSGLADVDCDWPEALQLAQYILPETGMVSGRKSSPRSHHFYICPKPPGYLKLTDRAVERGHEERNTIVELRYGKGLQSLVPPSVHPSGEAVEWYECGEPAVVDGLTLEQSVRKLAAAALLVKHYPAKGSRHDFALSLAGGLCRRGMPEAEAVKLITSIARVAGDEEWEARGGDVLSTYATLRDGGAATGWPRLTELVSAWVVQQVREW